MIELETTAVSGWWALAVGLGLGVRHAFDADHVAVISLLVQHQPRVQSAARAAALWGLGHCASFLGLGVLVVLFGVRLPPAFDVTVELGVGAMLAALGTWQLFGADRRSAAAPSVAAPLRPVVIGCVHGLAGSATLALVTATTIGSPDRAAICMVAFGMGTIFAMVALTAALAGPLAWATRGDRGRRVVVRAAATVSVVLGAVMIACALRDGVW